MRLGYNTNGFAHHRWQDTLSILSELGYQSVALTLDHNLLDPYQATSQDIDDIKCVLQEHGMHCVIETGARFLLDPFHKHEPTLLHPDAERRALRIDFLKRCIDLAKMLDADAVSFWSGILKQDISYSTALDRLSEGCQEVLDYAEDKHIRLAFEPEPGMLIESMAQFAELKDRLPSPVFGLTMDIGHLQCVEEQPIARYLKDWSSLIYNIHIEDMKTGIHEHLKFGHGDIDFAPIFQTLQSSGYDYGIHVELSRHSHEAPTAAAESMEFMRKMLNNE